MRKSGTCRSGMRRRRERGHQCRVQRTGWGAGAVGQGGAFASAKAGLRAWLRHATPIIRQWICNLPKAENVFQAHIL